LRNITLRARAAFILGHNVQKANGIP